jgi:hypothetical protein
MSAVAEVRHLSPLAGRTTVEAGAVPGRAFVDDPLLHYYFEGQEDRSELVRPTMALATYLTQHYGTAFRLHSSARLIGAALLLPPEIRDFPLPAVITAVLRGPRRMRLRSAKLSGFVQPGVGTSMHRKGQLPAPRTN